MKTYTASEVVNINNILIGFLTKYSGWTLVEAYAEIKFLWASAYVAANKIEYCLVSRNTSTRRLNRKERLDVYSYFENAQNHATAFA